MDYWLFLAFGLLTLFLFIYLILMRPDIRSDFAFVFFVLFILSAVIIISEQSRFDEINISDYDFVINKKQECLKYSICKKILKDILDDGKIKNYELKNFKEVLNIANEEVYQAWLQEIENERKKKNEEELMKMKKELESK
jgi:ribosomal protein L28